MPDLIPNDDIPTSMPVDYPPADEDTVAPWLPTDPLPNPEPEEGSLPAPTVAS